MIFFAFDNMVLAIGNWQKKLWIHFKSIIKRYIWVNLILTRVDSIPQMEFENSYKFHYITISRLTFLNYVLTLLTNILVVNRDWRLRFGQVIDISVAATGFFSQIANENFKLPKIPQFKTSAILQLYIVCWVLKNKAKTTHKWFYKREGGVIH